jgi:hypothetical protein
MNDSTQNGSSLAAAGWFIHLVGWVICAASIFLAFSNKSADPPARLCVLVIICGFGRRLGFLFHCPLYFRAMESKGRPGKF